MTSLERSLFRQQALDAQHQNWLGTVRLATPISQQVWTIAAVSVGIAILVWLFAGHYTRRVHVTGTLVPRAGLISVTANSIGVVNHVAVMEGDRVHEGDVLVSLSGEHVSSSLGDTSAAVSEQLKHEAKSLAQDIRDSETLADEQAKDFHMQQSMYAGQLAQINNQLVLQKKQIDLVQGLLTKWTPLASKGYIAGIQIEQEQSTLLSDEAQRRVLSQQAIGLQQQLSSANDQLAQLPLATSAKINDFSRQLAQIEQSLAQNEASRASVLRAPSSGTVSSILVKSGESVSIGQPLLAVVPDGSTLQAQMLVPSQAIGFVRPGTEVSLHYQSFPYQKFGLQRGTVRMVSHSALTPSEVTLLLGGGQPPSNDPLYLVKVDLLQQTVSAYGHDEPLRPGMALDADLLLDHRRVVEWIFEPLYGMGRRLAKAP